MAETRSGHTGRERWPGGVAAITLFVEDLEETKRFYREVFGLPLHFEDADSAVFDFGNTIVNLLTDGAAHSLVPATVARRDSGSRAQLTVLVEDVDATCADLAASGVELLNGPRERPRGIRTASFVDPGGHIWEIAR